MSNYEERIEEALGALIRGDFTSLRQAAAFFQVSLSTLCRRRHGFNPRHETDLSTLRITSNQESIVVRWIQDLQRQRMSPNYPKIRSVMMQLLKKNGDSRPLGRH